MGRIPGWIDSAWIEIIRREFELRVCRRGIRIGEILRRLKKGRQMQCTKVARRYSLPKGAVLDL
jgi:hypothetical protein